MFTGSWLADWEQVGKCVFNDGEEETLGSAEGQTGTRPLLAALSQQEKRRRYHQH